MRLKGNQVEKPYSDNLFYFFFIGRQVCGGVCFVIVFCFETGFLYVVLAAKELRQGWPRARGNPPASAFRFKAQAIMPAFLIFEIGSV